MKVAMYFSGRIKTGVFSSIIDHLKDYQKKHEVVFFCSLNETNKDNYTINFCKELNLSDECLNIEQVTIPEEFLSYKYHKETNRQNVYSMFYHNKKCMELIDLYEKRHNLAFDVIIKYRADILSLTESIIDLQLCEENEIFIPDNDNYRDGVNDQIAYGNKRVMAIYSNCLDSISKYCKSKIYFHPESLVAHHIKESKLLLKRFIYSYELNSTRKE